MAIAEKTNAFVGTGGQSISLSQFVNVTASSSNPTYLILNALDRNEYTAAAIGATGSLSGNGRTLQLASIGSDARGAGIVFTYQASTGRYYSSIYGYLDQLTYTASGSFGDVTSLSLFGTNNLSLANAYAANAYAMTQVDASGYLGSATVVTQPTFTGGVPAQATPNSIAAVASSFVGQAWNMDGCWVLASTIAAEAGAGLPVQSTLIGIPGQSNGEWIVAFNGPAGQAGNWQSMVTAGEMIVIGTPGGGGHITTCVSGTGSTAQLVDNITWVNSTGQIVNLANDGSASDIIVSVPHAASQEWSGVQASSVVIYELDTPVVASKVGTCSLTCGASQGLGSLFSATDPAAKAITQWQVYDTASSDALLYNGTAYQDHTAASALTTSSLSSVSLLAGSTATTDTLEVRAYNGSYWGDWSSLAVTVASSGTSTMSVASTPPVVAHQTAGQTWNAGKAISLVLPANTFTDPQGQALAYKATLSNGQALPSWLRFDANARTFTGIAPSTVQNLGITVTATDTSGLSVAETFTARVQPAPGIMVSTQTPDQTWIDRQTVNLTLPSNTFTDLLGLKMTFLAYETAGPDVTAWLHFDPLAERLFGTVPSTQSGTVTLAVVARDTMGMSATDTFNVTFAPSGVQASAVHAAFLGAAGPVNPAQGHGLIALH
jgi:hypothetical protein